jgi:hypothetical protein
MIRCSFPYIPGMVQSIGLETYVLTSQMAAKLAREERNKRSFPVSMEVFNFICPAKHQKSFNYYFKIDMSAQNQGWFHLVLIQWLSQCRRDLCRFP